jgi:hypothetical protein
VLGISLVSLKIFFVFTIKSLEKRVAKEEMCSGKLEKGKTCRVMKVLMHFFEESYTLLLSSGIFFFFFSYLPGTPCLY